MEKYPFISIIALALLYLPNFLHSQGSEPVRVQHVEGRLISEVENVQAGVPFRVGLLLKHDPHWHTYWKASATGYATTIEWNLPVGWEASGIEWPVPERFETMGMVEYVYGGEVLLVSTITPPANYDSSQVEIAFSADWLMCADLCIPGSMNSRLVLPVGNHPPVPSTLWQEQFSSADSRLPASPARYDLQAWKNGNRVVLEISGALPETLDTGNPDSVYFFNEQGILIPSPAVSLEKPGRGNLRIELQADPSTEAFPDRLSGVLFTESGWPGAANAPALAVDVPLEPSPARIAPESTKLSLGLLVLAFSGGLILNLMPCVFPVIGIKIMGFVNQAGSSRRKVIHHGLVFTLGVLVSFWVMTAILLILRSGGNQLGWGFQLQSPAFVLILALFLFAFALNMSGLFEVGQSAVGVGSKLTGKSGLAGTFFGGILATVVATPCAAPFLAPALGAALAVPPLTSFLVFTVIALGLSTPYLLLSAFPGLVNRLPKPGPWMETFKQAMSFLLYATVAYLLWVLIGQLSNEDLFPASSLLKVLFSLIILALALWIYGRWAALWRHPLIRRTATAASLGLVALALFTGLSGTHRLDDNLSALRWEKWEPGKARELSRMGKTVYVDFTARWCVTCQTNKATVFSSDPVLETIRNGDIILLKADWTNKDPVIGEALQSFNRSAVPFNLVYRPGLSEPIILPEILTPGIVLKALNGTDGK